MNNYIKIATIFLTLLAVSFGVYKNFVTNEIVVKIGFCMKNESEDYDTLATYLNKNNKIYEKLQVLKDGKATELGLVSVLDNCTIIDINNWTCGHNPTPTGSDDGYTVINGKFQYLYGEPRNGCIVKFKQLN